MGWPSLGRGQWSDTPSYVHYAAGLSRVWVQAITIAAAAARTTCRHDAVQGELPHVNTNRRGSQDIRERVMLLIGHKPLTLPDSPVWQPLSSE